MSSRSSLFARGDEALIQKTCKNTTNYKLCIQLLESDPNSHNVDVTGLALIVVEAVDKRVDTAASYVSALLRGTKDPHLQNVLGQCQLMYSSASLAIKVVPDALRAKMYGMYGVAMNYLNNTRGYPGLCQDSFRRNPPLIYPVELAQRQGVLEAFCTVGLDIIPQIPEYM